MWRKIDELSAVVEEVRKGGKTKAIKKCMEKEEEARMKVSKKGGMLKVRK